MNLFGSSDLVVPELSDDHVARALAEIRRNARNRRLAMMAPLALVAAVVGAFMASPQRYGGLALVADADAANTQLPRVFGANGVWRVPEVIGDSPLASPGPASVVEAPSPLPAPDYQLVPPSEEELNSLPVSASTPPMPTPGQFAEADPVADDARIVPDLEDPEPAAGEIDWSNFLPVIVVASGPSVDPAGNDTTSSTPEDSASADDSTPPTLSSQDEDVSVAATQPEEPTGEIADPATAVIGDLGEANPSTPAEHPAEGATQPASRIATIIPQTVLVHSAHVSVTVRVVDDDSSVIDWCNTRVDWGDGSVTGVTVADEVALCAASCEHEASSSATGIDAEIVFTHQYQQMIDAAPRIFVATGDGCNYTLAEYQLNEFFVVPY